MNGSLLGAEVVFKTKNLVISFFRKSHKTPCSPPKFAFTTCANPTIHLFYPLPHPPHPPKKKNCIGIVFDFSWVSDGQDKLQTMIM